MSGEKRFLRTIRARNILSFGPESPEIELRGLNVLIGPNGAGKSNLIDVISLLQAAPTNLLEPIQAGGGIGEWLWKGPVGAMPGSVALLVAASGGGLPAEIDVTVDYPQGTLPVRHRLAFTMVGQRLELWDEAIENERRSQPSEPDADFYYRYQHGRPVLNVPSAWGPSPRKLRREDLPLDQSVLSQRKDPDQYPELTYLGNQYAKIRLFREWNLGRHAPARRPQSTDLPVEFLREDAANIALVLNDLVSRANLRSNLVEKLKNADDTIVDFSTPVLGGTIGLFLHHAGFRSPVPATRLSDGTARYLCLLAVLCHPTPPPLVCLEEPELGLHPDLLPGLADLLVEASERMQLIVTTHSDALVDGLTKVPEAVLICEKRNGSTEMSRRASAELTQWLKDYGLGQLWRRGELGGNRW